MADLLTTLVVQFEDGLGAEDDGFLTAEIDSRPDGLNNGDTSFEAGDPVHFLVYMSANTSISEIIASDGGVFPAGSFNIAVEEFVTFAKTRKASASKPITGAVSVQWFGNNLGSVSVANDQVSLIAAQEGVAVAKLTYTTIAKAYRLSTNLNPDPNYKIIVVIIGKV